MRMCLEHGGETEMQGRDKKGKKVGFSAADWVKNHASKGAGR
jgi:hypothetical protein